MKTTRKFIAILSIAALMPFPGLLAQFKSGAPALEALLMADPLVEELQDIRRGMSARILETGTPFDRLREAYRLGDESKILELMGYGPLEARMLQVRLTQIRVELFQRYPELESIAKAQILQLQANYLRSFGADGGSGLREEIEGMLPDLRNPIQGAICAPCDIDRFFSALPDLLVRDAVAFAPLADDQIRMAEPIEITDDVTCDWTPYLASLALCTLAGPAWYWPCAYVALCAYCEGGWVDSACF